MRNYTSIPGSQEKTFQDKSFPGKRNSSQQANRIESFRSTPNNSCLQPTAFVRYVNSTIEVSEGAGYAGDVDFFKRPYQICKNVVISGDIKSVSMSNAV